MFEYWICNEADDEIFEKQCNAIEKKVTPLEKRRLLKDVDGSLIQIYAHQGKEILIYSDHFINEVYIKSEVKLEQFFNDTTSQ